jgi:hypothetical protein
MKIVLGLLFSIFGLMPASCNNFNNVNNFNCTKGSGHIIEVTKNIKEFKGVVVDNSADVIITKGDNIKVKIITDDNLVNSITTEIKGNNLIIDEVGNNCPTKIEIQIETPYLNLISLNGSGNITANDIKITEGFTAEIDGSGNIKIDNLESQIAGIKTNGSGNIHIKNLKSFNLETEIAGSGDIKIDNAEVLNSSISLPGSGNIAVAGTTTNNNIRIDGSGDINCKNFISKIVKARIDGSGSITINVKDELTASIDGSGDIYYIGNPTVKSLNVLGSGRIVKKD